MENGSRARRNRLGLLLAALLASPWVASAASQDLPTIGLDEIHPGQKGYGLSVWNGRRPERFGVEVLGVMQNTSPDTSYILARLSGRGLEGSGVIAGMSGSPVFLDGRLAGAVAFSWSFSKEPIAGITPIAGMRRLTELPPAPPTGATGLVSFDRLRSGDLPSDLLARGLARLQPSFAGGARSSLEWSAAGFDAGGLDLLRQGLGTVAPAGSSSPSGQATGGTLEPGDAVAAVLVDGDLRLAATGTVTERRGDAITAFGHPFLGIGPIRVPMAVADIVTVVANQMTSFKIANLGPRVGAFEQDRQLGIEGRLGEAAPMVPMTVHVVGAEGGESHAYHMEVAREPQLAPLLLAVSTLGSLGSATYSGGTQGLDFVAHFQLTGYGEVTARQSFDGAGAVGDAVNYLIAFSSFLVQNDFAQVDLAKVDVELSQTPRPRTVTLIGAHAERTVVKPGDPVVINLDMVPYRGSAFRRLVRFDLPEDVPDGRYHVFVGDGTSIDAARASIEKVEPVTFSQALGQLERLHSRRDLVVLGVFAGRGLSVAGEVMPRLPSSIQSLWRAAASGSSTPLRLAVAQEHVEPLDAPLEGAVRIDLEVRRREPVAAESGEGPEATDRTERPKETP